MVVVLFIIKILFEPRGKDPSWDYRHFSKPRPVVQPYNDGANIRFGQGKSRIKVVRSCWSFSRKKSRDLSYCTMPRNYRCAFYWALFQCDIYLFNQLIAAFSLNLSLFKTIYLKFHILIRYFGYIKIPAVS